MKAKLICRTAIGLFVASSVLPSATAQNCDTEFLIEEVTKTETLRNGHGLMSDESEHPCWASQFSRERLGAQLPEPIPMSVYYEPEDYALKLATTPVTSAAPLFSVVQLGHLAVASREQAIAIGYEARAEEAATIAIGSGAITIPIESLAIGSRAKVEAGALSSLALGTNANVANGARQSMALGAYSFVGWPRGLAIGYRARSEALGAVALGAFSVADEADTVSIGRADNPSTSYDETLLRRLSNLDDGIADTDAVNYRQLKLALDGLDLGFDYLEINASGPNAQARAPNSMAFGPSAVAGAGGSIAFGAGAKSLFVDSYAFGANTQTTRNSQFMFGTRLSNYSMPGLVNPRSRMLQEGPLQLVTVDENGTLAGDGGATVSNLQLSIAAQEEGINHLNQQVTDLEMEVSTHTSAINRHEVLIEENTAAIHRNEVSIDENAATINRHESAIDENKAAINRNQSAINENAAAINRNETSIQTNRSAIENNTADLQRLEKQAADGVERFESIESNMATHETRMDGIDETLVVHDDRMTETTAELETVKSVAHENQARIARNQSDLAAQSETVSLLQTEFEQLGLSVYALAETVAHQSRQIETNKSGIAIANALAGSSWLQANETTSLTLNAGYFDGSSALAVSGARRLHNHWSANFAVGTDTARGEIGARAGLRLGW
ncbi:MAG: YadA-like family protein [Henriciella sp.]